MDKVCSPEEIEKKRLLALQRRKEAQLKAQNTFSSPLHDQFKHNEKKNIKDNIVRSSPMHEQCKHSDSTNIIRQNRPSNRFNPMESKSFFNKRTLITGNCYMITDDRFAVEISAFVSEIIDTFKTIPSRAYDVKTRIWNFHINDYENLIQKLMCHNPRVSVTKIPENILQIFKKNLNSDKQIVQDLSKIDERLISSLMPFQRDGVCYGISKSGRCMIADDMGLGKTIQALGIAHYFKENWPLLIVVPSSVRYQWSEAIYEFLPSVPAHYIHHFSNAKEFIGDEKITIVSYDILVRAIEIFKKHIYGFVILDESHVLKSNKTARFQAAQEMCTHARHVVLLTGTPALSRPIELHSQISLISPRFIRYEDYGIRYCAGQRSTFGWDFSGSSNLQELQLLLRSTCMIRRLKANVLNQLPAKIRQVIVLDHDLIKAGTKQMKEMSTLLQKKITGLERHNALLQYYNESSFARLKAVCKYVTDLFEKKRKCLLYAHHQVVLDAICKVADSMKIRYVRIDGKTSPEQRKIQVDTFQENDDYLAAILSITAANAGVTLTAANLVVFAELFWNPGILCQAEDRAHRIGQNDSVIIQYLVAKDTADDYIWPLIKKKMNVLNAAGLDHDLSVDNVDIQKETGQQNLISFLSMSSSSGEESQHDKESQNTRDTIKREEQEESQNTRDTIKQEEQGESQNIRDIIKREEQEESQNIRVTIKQEKQEASTSTMNFKDLLEIDEECFDSCDWDNMQ